jgi:hypothetical protein
MNQPLADTLINRFLATIPEDPRIAAVHISLYLALVQRWKALCYPEPLRVFSHEVMPVCKISRATTYCRILRELSAYGYLCYLPSFNHNRGSRVYFPLQSNEDKPSAKGRTMYSENRSVLMFL